MNDLVSQIFQKYGFRFVLVVAMLLAIGTWGLAHLASAPGGEVSVLWGLVSYTKAGASFDKVSVEAGDAKNETGAHTPESDGSLPNAAKGSPDLPHETNFLLLNACDKDTAHAEIGRELRAVFPGSQVSEQYDWSGRWEMIKTRFYFSDVGFRLAAYELAGWFPGDQDVIDYKKQLSGDPPFFSDRPRDRSGRMVDFRRDRDIVVFVGNDYQEILETLQDANSRRR